MAEPYEVTRIALARAIHHRHDPAEIQALRDQLAEQVLERRIKVLVDAAPPLSERQRARIRALLGGPGAGAPPPPPSDVVPKPPKEPKPPWQPKTHCPNGHPYDESNTGRHRGKRYCLACRRQQYAKKAAERAAKAADQPADPQSQAS